MFAHEAGPVAARLERETPLRWQPIAYSDYHAQLPGGRPQGGRTLEPQPIDPDPRIARARAGRAERHRAGHLRRARDRRDRQGGACAAGRAGHAHARARAPRRARRGLPRRRRRLRDGHQGAGAPRGGRRRPHDRRLRAGPRARPRVPPRANAGAGRRADGARRRATARDGGGRGARPDERGVVVPCGDDSRGLDRRRADAPADPHRARAPGLDPRQRSRHPVRRRGAELQRPRSDPAELRADVLLVPERAGLARLRRSLPQVVPARPALASRPRPGLALARRDARASWPARSTSRGRRSRRR